jgi:ATP-dependent Lon protease
LIGLEIIQLSGYSEEEKLAIASLLMKRAVRNDTERQGRTG